MENYPQITKIPHLFRWLVCCYSMEPSGKEKELQAELTKKRREFERVRNEKDAARLEVEYMKSKVKVGCIKMLFEWVELPHYKTNKMACAPSEDSDQPGRLPSLIGQSDQSIHCLHEENLGP